jgi:hypothetical protein
MKTVIEQLKKNSEHLNDSLRSVTEHLDESRAALLKQESYRDRLVEQIAENDRAIAVLERAAVTR